LATAIKVERSNVSEFLSGKHLPSFEAFVSLLYFFNCSADYLLGLTDMHTEEPLHEVPPFGERLRALLKAQKISQAQLIRELPISSAVPYKWLSGKNFPSVESLIRLAEYLDCSVDYLIGRVR
jgi:transcriptional regulator with XRE-family HTH domain